MALPYSTRLLSFNGNGYSPVISIAAGKRCVIKTLVANNGENVAKNIIVLVSGAPIYTFSLPGYGGAVSPPMMYVVYAGETLQVFNGGGALSTSVHGYLLSEAG